jgi:hypothetical protein
MDSQINLDVDELVDLLLSIRREIPVDSRSEDIRRLIDRIYTEISKDIPNEGHVKKSLEKIRDGLISGVAGYVSKEILNRLGEILN